MPRRIAFVNEKGGSAKTTLTSSVAAHLALHRGQRVLAIDTDPQGHLGKVLGVQSSPSRRGAADLLLDEMLDQDALAEQGAGPLPAMPSRIPGLDVVLADKSLALLPGLGAGDDPSGRLDRNLDAIHALDDYDYVLFDGAPSFGTLTLNVLRAAREVVIPVPLTYLALDGCAELLRTLHTVRTHYDHPALEIAMVVPTFYRRTRMAHEVLDSLKARFPKELSQTALGFHVKIDEAQSRGLSVFEHAPGDRAARALAAIAEELELRTPASRS